MSFINFIEKIQNKPRYVRIWILGLFVSVFTVVTVSLWIASLRHSSFRSDLAETKEEIYQGKDKIIDGAFSKADIPAYGKEKALSLKDALKASISAFFKDDIEKEIDKQTEEEKTEKPSVQKGGSEAIKPMKLPLSR